MLALPLATYIKARNSVVKQKAAPLVNVQTAGAPVTIADQILFPHGI